MVGSVGVDIVRVSRVREIANRRGQRFLARYFSEGELGYSLSKRDAYSHLAARFAAKEAAHKAFCAAGMGSLPLSSFEVAFDSSGVPRLGFSSGASNNTHQADAFDLSISLSHDGDYAIAVVILFGPGLL